MRSVRRGGGRTIRDNDLCVALSTFCEPICLDVHKRKRRKFSHCVDGGIQSRAANQRFVPSR